MIKIHKNEKGFTGIEGLLILLVVAVIGFGGYYVWYTQHKTEPATATVTTTASTKPATTTKTTTTTTRYLQVTQLGIEIPINSTISDLSYSWDTSQTDAWFGSSSLGQQSISPSSTCGITSTPQTFNQSLSPDPTDPNPIELNDILIGTVSKISAGANQSNYTKTITLGGTTYGFVVFPTDCSSTQAFNTALSNYIRNFETAFSNAKAIG